jgi:hypothetical protein
MSLFLTVLIGVLVFVIGQGIQRFVLEPIQQQRKIIGDIATARLFLANVAHAAAHEGKGIQYPEDPTEASRRLRALAAGLHASLWSIPAYGCWSGLRLIPDRQVVVQVTKEIIGWSNSLQPGHAGREP